MIGLGGAVGVVALAVVWVAGRRRSRLAWVDSGEAFELVPEGARPDDAQDIKEGVGQALEQMAAMSGVGRRRRTNLTVVRWWDGGSARLGIVLRGTASPGSVARIVAKAIRAEARPVGRLDVPELAGGWKRVTRVGVHGYSDEDPPAVDSLAGALHLVFSESRSGDQVFAVGVRPMRPWEADLVRGWVAARVGESKTSVIEPGALAAVRVYAGGDHAASLCGGLGQHLRRFRYSLMVRRVDDGRLFAPVVAVAAVGGVAAVSAGTAWGFGPGVPIGVAAFVFGVVAGGSWVSNRPGFTRRRVAADVADGLVAVPSPRRVSLRRGVLNLVTAATDVDPDTPGRQRGSTHPHPADVLSFQDVHVASVVAFPPQADVTIADVGTSLGVHAPPAVREAVGIPLGSDPAGAPVKLPEIDRKAGVLLVGEAGSGKTEAVEGIFASDLIARGRGFETDPAPLRGGRTGMFFMNAKDPATTSAVLGICRGLGFAPTETMGGGFWSTVVINPHAATGPRLELFDRSDPAGSARRMVDAMVYAFDEGDIRASSEDMLRAAFEFALAVTPGVAAKVGLDPRRLNVVELAMAVLGGGAETGARTRLENEFQALWRAENAPVGGGGDGSDQAFGVFGEDGGEALSDLVVSADMSPQAKAWAKWASYASMPARAFDERAAAPRNKLGELLGVDLWSQDPTRPEVTLGQLIDQHRVVVFDFATGAQSERIAQRVASIVLYSMWVTIRGMCDNWLADGRTSTVYADELRMVSGGGTGGDALMNMRDLGRSFGLRLVFGTQRIGSLARPIAETAKGFGAKMWLRTANRDDQDEAVADLGTDGQFSASDIARLPVGSALASIRVNDQVQPPFTIRFPLAADVSPAWFEASVGLRPAEDDPDDKGAGGRGRGR